MMRRYYRARISLAEMENPMASVASTILSKAEIEVETSHSSEGQGIDKSTSNSLTLQAPTELNMSSQLT